MTGILVLEAVSKAFGGLQAISGLSLEVPAGTILAVVGSGGSGKTTLIDLIAGACRPDSGTIHFQGHAIGGLRPDRVCAAGIARTFHPPRPLGSLSALETVTVAALLRHPTPAVARQYALDLLERLELVHAAGRPAGHLPEPERQRLELARALATRPRLLLLDEPLAGLPEAELGRTAGMLQALNQRSGLTVLLTEPRLDTALAITDQVLLLDHGHLFTTPPPP